MSIRPFLLWELVKRDFQSRYVGSVLGVFWALLQPLWQLVLYSFVFSTVLKISLFGERTESFAVFLFCGLLPWIAVHEGVVRSATAITDNGEVVKKIRLPLEVLVISVVLGGLIHEAIAAGVFVAVLAATGQLGWQGLPLLLVALPLQAGLTLGLGFLLCSVHTLFRDTAQFLGLALTGWFFLTPIVYPLNQVPQPYREWIEWNPLAMLVSMYRQAFLAGELVWVGTTGRLMVVMGVLLAAGWWLFHSLKPTFADEI